MIKRIHNALLQILCALLYLAVFPLFAVAYLYRDGLMLRSKSRTRKTGFWIKRIPDPEESENFERMS